MERIKECSKIKFSDWKVKDVKYVLRQLKPGISEDTYNLSNKIFKPEAAGDNLVLALTKPMNRIKKELEYATIQELCKATNLYICKAF